MTDALRNGEERFALYRLCECTSCGGTGRDINGMIRAPRCDDCRGEGRERQLLATAATAEAVGVALVTLAREGEFDECPIGVLDTQGETGKKWLIRPWLPSARNISDAGRTLAQAKSGKGKT